MGDLKIFGPCWSPTGTKSDGGGLAKKSDWSRNCPPNAKLGHFLLFYAWNTAFQGTFELKSSQIWHKTVFKFFKFSETNLGWGDKPWSKIGDKCRMGGLTKFSLDGGTPQSPREKKHAEYPHSSWKVLLIGATVVLCHTD